MWYQWVTCMVPVNSCSWTLRVPFAHLEAHISGLALIHLSRVSPWEPSGVSGVTRLHTVPTWVWWSIRLLHRGHILCVCDAQAAIHWCSSVGRLLRAVHRFGSWCLALAGS